MKTTTSLKLLTFVILFNLISIKTINAQAWVPVGSTGLDSTVNALAVYNGELYAGGFFQNSDGHSTPYIAKWTGTNWDTVGSGMDAYVTSMAVYDSALYVGGNFNSAGGNTLASKIAKWNGTTWSAVGVGTTAVIEAFTTYHGSLIVGAKIGYIGGITNKCIAAWDGSSFSVLGTGMNNYVSALAVYNDSLYAGGSFTTAGTITTASKIAKWNGTAWSELGTGISASGVVKAMAVYHNELYVGGTFTSAGGVPAVNIAKWNGTSWSAIGTGMNFNVSCLTVFNGDLYAGGSFTTANGVSANKIARFDGTSWHPMGTGMNTSPGSPSVQAIAIYDSTIYAGGSFTSASGNSTEHRVAKWDTTSTSHLGIDEHSNVNSINIYPNPFTSSATLSFDKQYKNATIKVIDILGKTLKTFNFSGNQTIIEKGDLAQGVYFVQLITHSSSSGFNDEIVFTKKMIVQ